METILGLEKISLITVTVFICISKQTQWPWFFPSYCICFHWEKALKFWKISLNQIHTYLLLIPLHITLKFIDEEWNLLDCFLVIRSPRFPCLLYFLYILQSSFLTSVSWCPLTCLPLGQNDFCMDVSYHRNYYHIYKGNDNGVPILKITNFLVHVHEKMSFSWCEKWL